MRWPRDMWNSVLFTDDSRFCLDRPDIRIRVWWRTGERYAKCCVIEGDKWGGARVIVQGGISGDHKIPLVCINGTLTAQRYIDNILQAVVLPFLQHHDDVTTFQQDNAPHRSARISMEYFNNVNVNVMPWPAYSPDLSPTEHLLNIGKTCLDRRENKPQYRAELIAAVQEEWETIPQRQIQRLIRSIIYETQNGNMHCCKWWSY